MLFNSPYHKDVFTETLVPFLKRFFDCWLMQKVSRICAKSRVLPRRLAYPEHLPAALRDACLYDDPGDLEQRLRGLLAAPRWTGQDRLRTFVAQCDWDRQGPRYDNYFESLAASVRTKGPPDIE